MAERAHETDTWTDLFGGLYDRLTGSNAEIIYDFDSLEIDVPSSTKKNAPYAHWKFNGTLRISTRDKGSEN